MTNESANGKGFIAEVLVGAFILWPSGHESRVAQALVADGFSRVQQVLIWFLEVCDHSGWASNGALVRKSCLASDRSSGNEKDLESSSGGVLPRDAGVGRVLKRG